MVYSIRQLRKTFHIPLNTIVQIRKIMQGPSNDSIISENSEAISSLVYSLNLNKISTFGCFVNFSKFEECKYYNAFKVRYPLNKC